MGTVKPVRVALYIRVSTADQLRGFGLDMQENALLRYVSLREPEGWHVPPNGTFIEQKTGATQDRPVLQRLMTCVEAGQFEYILVWKLDRISRSLSDLMDIQGKLDRFNANLMSMKEQLDFSTPSGRLVFHMFGALAEFERDTIQMRTEEGKRTSALAGNYVGGQAPYGYQKIKNPNGKGSRLHIVDKEADVVRQLFHWYVHDDLSVADIARRLNEIGIKKGTAARSRQRHRPWHETTVRTILRNETYQGLYVANRFINKGKKRLGERPREDWIISNVDPTVSPLLFSQAQEKNKSVYSQYRGGGKQVYMLSRKLVDHLTGKTFVGYLSGKRTKNYRRKKFQSRQGRTYRTISVAARGLDDFVWRHVERALSTPERFLREYQERSTRSSTQAGLQERLAVVSVAATEARDRCDRVERDFYDGHIDSARRDDLLTRYTPEYAAAAAEQKKVEDELAALGGYEQGCNDLREAAKRFKERLSSLTYEEKAKLCTMFVDRVEILDEDGARTATAYLRFDPPSTVQPGEMGRTEKPQPEGMPGYSRAKSSMGGKPDTFGYQPDVSTAYRFEVSHVILPEGSRKTLG